MLGKRSFKFRLILTYVLVVMFSFGFIAFFLDRNLEVVSIQEIKSSLLNQAYLVEGSIPPENIIQENLSPVQGLFSSISQKTNCRLTLVDRQGKVLADSSRMPLDILRMDSHAGRPEVRSALAGRIGEDIRYSSTLRIDMLYVAIPIQAQKNIIAALRLALPLTRVQAMLWAVRKIVFMAFVFSLGLAFVIGSVLAGGIIKPVNKILQASRRFAQGNFTRRISLDANDELGELALTLNKMAQDIEDKIKEVQIQNQHLSAVLSSMIEGVIVLDAQGRISSLNPTAEKIFAVKSTQAAGKYFLEAISNSALSELIGNVFAQGVFVSRELSLEWPVPKFFEVNASPIFVKKAVGGCLVVIHDITEIRRLETIRKDFVANVSHELKTPLTSIKGFVETLLEGALDDKEHRMEFLSIVRDHTNRLNNLVNDLLALSYLESNDAKHVIAFEEVALRDLAEKVLLGFKSQLKKKSIDARNEVPSVLMVKADKDTLEQVLTNLIDNAIKFNLDNGTLKIYSQDVPMGTRVIVEDSGIGIPRKDIPRIFERFYRVDKARSRQLGGTGLGLSIVKHIVELHGGSFGVESVELAGSKFWFVLPRF